MSSLEKRSNRGAPDLASLVPSAPATFLISFACVGVFARFRMDGEPQTADDWARWGVVEFERLFDGRAWGLLSSCVVHVEPLHLLFNLWWLWELGVQLERWLGTWKYVGLVVASGLVSSWAQGISGEWLGHGYSGVNYALFGFAWLSAPRHPELRDVVHSRNVTWMMVWLAGCFVATELGTANIGNGAHIGGLVFGVLLALATVRNRAWSYGLLALLFAALTVAGVWRPWSAPWSWNRAWEAHERGELDRAEAYYRSALRVGYDEAAVWSRLAHVHAVAGDTEAFRIDLEKLRSLDPSSAKSLERLPAQLAETRASALEHQNAPDSEVWKGYVASQEWRFEDARRHFNAQLESTPGDPASLQWRAYAYLDDPLASSDDVAHAVRDALAAVEASKHRDVEALSLAADALRRSGDSASARRFAEEAQALVRAGRAVSDRARERIESFGLRGR
jgi:membrane associated rhomboid family serine protease